MRSLSFPALRAGLFSLAVVGLLVVGAPGQAEEEVAFMSMGELTHEHREMVSTSGAEVLTLIASAHEKINAYKWSRATRDVGKARAILLKVRELSPAVRMKDQLSSAQQKAQASKATGDDLLPVYAELDALKYQEEDVAVRAHLDRAKGHLAKGAQVEAAEELHGAAWAIHYLEIDLPIQETLSRLDRALLLLHRKDRIGARAALRDAERHVVVTQALASGSEAGVVLETAP